VALAAALVAAGCGGFCRSDPPPPELPMIQGADGREYLLLARGPHTPEWGADGELVSVAYDRNGDGRPDQVAHHDGARLPSLVANDDDFDGASDHWIHYDDAGELVKVGVSRHGGLVQDLWIYPGPGGQPARQEYDDDGDGLVERAEVIHDGRVVQVEVDADRDGRIDRWQDWSAGRLGSEKLDTDGDGQPDRVLRYDADGRVVGLEPIDG
jgi:hypothetical protein